MPPRFYAPDLAPGRPLVVLPAGEAAHLTRVMRLGVGDLVGVFDGRGQEFLARVASVRGGRVSVRPEAQVRPAPECGVKVTLGQAVLKGDAMDDLVRDAVMLGVASVQPVVTARTVPSLAALHRARRVTRWQRIAIASAKQCGRAVVPDIRVPVSFAAFVNGDRSELRVMLVEPAAADADAAAAGTLAGRPKPATATLLVGPEGGWAEEEIAEARRRGWLLIRLGRRTLRADAAPAVALAVLQCLWGEM